MAKKDKKTKITYTCKDDEKADKKKTQFAVLNCHREEPLEKVLTSVHLSFKRTRGREGKASGDNEGKKSPESCVTVDWQGVSKVPLQKA